MADLTAPYTLAGTGSVVFNNGLPGDGTDLYWIQAIRGLDGPAIRAPVDDLPFGDGGIVHTFWKGPRRVTLEGVLIVQSVPTGGSCQPQLNTMETALNGVLDSILDVDGTLSWNGSSLAVRYEGSLDIQPAENYATRSFTFGLVSAAADPS